MKFIFPQNYNFKNKLFGVIDYSTAILNLLWIVFICFICNLFFRRILCFPLFLFSLIGFNNENILYVIFYFFKFLLRPKIYVFNK